MTIFWRGLNFRGEPLGLVGVRIEVVADPFGEFGVAFVGGALDGFEKFGIAPGTATILGRTASADFDQTRIKHARLGINKAPDLDRVLPAEVGEDKNLGAKEV